MKMILVIANVIIAVFALGMPQKSLNAQNNNCNRGSVPVILTTLQHS